MRRILSKYMQLEILMFWFNPHFRKLLWGKKSKCVRGYFLFGCLVFFFFRVIYSSPAVSCGNGCHLKYVHFAVKVSLQCYILKLLQRILLIEIFLGRVQGFVQSLLLQFWVQALLPVPLCNLTTSKTRKEGGEYESFQENYVYLSEYLSEHKVLFLGWIILRRACLLLWKPASNLVVCGSERHEEVICEINDKTCFFTSEKHACMLPCDQVNMKTKLGKINL